MTLTISAILFNLISLILVIFFIVLFNRDHFIIKKNHEQWDNIKLLISGVIEIDESILYNTLVKSLDYPFMLGKYHSEG